MYTVLYERNPLRHTRIIALLRFTQSSALKCAFEVNSTHIQ